MCADRGLGALEGKRTLSEPPWRVGPKGLVLGSACSFLRPRAGFSRPHKAPPVNGEPGDLGQISHFSGCLNFHT